MKNKKNGSYLFFCKVNRKQEFINRLRSMGIVETITGVKKPKHKEISFSDDILLFNLNVKEASIRRKLNRIQVEFLD